MNWLDDDGRWRRDNRRVMMTGEMMHPVAVSKTVMLTNRRIFRSLHRFYSSIANARGFLRLCRCRKKDTP